MSKKLDPREEQLKELFNKLGTWEIPEGALDRVHDSARSSLNEVKALTEYEDGKISRLLTIVAFLSAVVGAAFTRFASDYKWPSVRLYSADVCWWLPFLTYVTFFIYVTLVTSAVIVLLLAIRPKFNKPASWSGSGRAGLPGSMLFYGKILDVSAGRWADAFISQTGEQGIELKKSYAKCYVGEAYLVAEKVAAKLRLADPGILALLWAMVILLIFFLSYAATAQFVLPTK